MRVTVVGAGIMGLSAARAMARRGHEVTVVEQHAVPNPLGASVDQHRLIRHAYGAMAGYAAMVAPAFAAWEDVWRDLGERLYHRTGTLAVGTADHRWLFESAATLEAEGTAVEWLSMADLEARFPLIRAGGLTHAFLLPTGGVLFAERIVAAMARHLARIGATLAEEARAAAIEPWEAAVRLAGGERIAADRLVVAAGPWAPALVAGLTARVIPSRQVVVYLRPPQALLPAWRAMPMVLDIDPGRGLYLVPPVGDTGLKTGDHSFTLTGDPDEDREAGAEEAMVIFERCRRRLADGGRYSIDHARTCFYDVEGEERFVVEPLTERTWVLSGFSGHGFKFGPLIGERLAEVLEGRAEGAALTRWAAGRGQA
jgi:glycine/D-amino acid oxidase-like deaminating enzyme